MNYRAVAAAAVALSCGQEAPRAPACGIVQVGGPTVILQSFQNVARVVTDPPRGLAPTLPARVVGDEQNDALVGYGEAGIVIGFQGTGFPSENGFGLLVIDDSTDAVKGVLIYQSANPPEDYPEIGIVSGAAAAIPLYGVRVRWDEISNARCPLLGRPE